MSENLFLSFPLFSPKARPKERVEGDFLCFAWLRKIKEINERELKKRRKSFFVVEQQKKKNRERFDVCFAAIEDATTKSW
jgi:hypothetical protein